MKIIGAYFFLLLYTLAMCKPVLPLVKDGLAHVFWKAQHLAIVHDHHGDHHAQMEIAESEKEKNSDQRPASSKISEPVSVHIIAEFFYSIPQLITQKQEFSVNIFNVSSISVDKYYPPPRWC